MEFLLKAVISGILVATVSTVAQRNATLASLLMGIPFTAFLAMIFMWYAGIDVETFSKFSFETVYFVLTSLVFFVIFGVMISYVGFWYSMLLGSIVTIILYNVVLRLL
jgi:hypothetical protein